MSSQGLDRPLRGLGSWFLGCPRVSRLWALHPGLQSDARSAGSPALKCWASVRASVSRTPGNSVRSANVSCDFLLTGSRDPSYMEGVPNALRFPFQFTLDRK